MQKVNKQQDIKIKQLTYDLQDTQKKLQETQYTLDVNTEELNDFKQKVQSLEVIKYDYSEQIDDLQVKLLEMTKKYNDLLNNFEAHFHEEREQMASEFQKQAEEAEMAKVQIIDVHDKQMQQKQFEIDQLKEQL